MIPNPQSITGFSIKYSAMTLFNVHLQTETVCSDRPESSLIDSSVENRTKDTLLEIIKRWVRPGSIIMSDGWSAYKCLQNNGFNHLVVNHSNEYKDPLTGAHTNTIEGLWMHAKRERNGNSYVTDALIEYMWRRRFHATTGTTQMGVSMNSLMLCISRVFRD